MLFRSTLDFFGGLDGSCNPYYVTLGQMMGAETFCNYMQDVYKRQVKARSPAPWPLKSYPAALQAWS